MPRLLAVYAVTCTVVVREGAQGSTPAKKKRGYTHKRKQFRPCPRTKHLKAQYQSWDKIKHNGL